MNTDGIILDIDGTLWNSTPIVAKAWNEILETRSDIPFRFTAEQLAGLFGRPLPVIADMAFPFLPEADRYALIDECCRREHELLRASSEDILYPGVDRTIRTLSRSVPLFIVSNCQCGYIELFLEKTGLGAFITDSECAGNTGLPKGPNIRMTAERNHLSRPVYVGDIDGDRIAAEEADVRFCHASYGFGAAARADWVIRRFDELLELFA
ncbi:MAG: HAD family hydrolase [Eubacteriales bacterium]|nr:HAD family hydrolase [Eubacteriales bacterium]